MTNEVNLVQNNVVVDSVGSIREFSVKILNKAQKCALIKAKTSAILNKAVFEEMTDIFKKLVDGGKKFKMNITDIDDEDEETFIVDLITIGHLQDYSITDFLLHISNVEIKPRISIQIKAIKPYVIPNEASVTVRRIETPNEIYVSVNEQEQDELVMSLEMSSFYEQHKNYTLILPGVKCAIEDPIGVWQRVEVCARPDSDGWTEVKFIDSASKIAFVEWQRLFELDEQFYDFPSYSVPISLGGIAPVGDSWSDESFDFLQNNLIDAESPIKYFGKSDNAKLFILNKQTKVNVNQMLIFHGFARPADNAQSLDRVYEPIEVVKPALIQPSEKLHRVEIVDLENFDPLNFRVKLLEYMDNEKEIPQRSGIIWKVGDICLAYCAVDKGEIKFHRGVITRMLNTKVHVVLCEFGIKVETPITYLRPCQASFKRFKFSTVAVKLACALKQCPWTKDVKKIIRPIVLSYDRYFILFKDEDNAQFTHEDEPRPVILWGQLGNGTKLDIIRQLVELNVVQSNADCEEGDLNEYSNVYDDVDDVPADMPPLVPLNNKIEMMKDFPMKRIKPEADEDKYVQIQEFKVLLKKQTIEKWLPAIRTTSSNFHALATYVDKKGCIILHEYKHKAVLDQMKTVINQLFDKSCSSNYKFKLHDPCLVRFESDARFYRGIVVDILGRSNYIVEFVDYGNIQRCDSKDLIREVVCVEIPPLAQKFRLEGLPTNAYQQVDKELLDKLHLTLCEMNIEVNVLTEDMLKSIPNYVKRVHITVDRQVIKSYEQFLLIQDEFIKPVNSQEKSPKLK